MHHLLRTCLWKGDLSLFRVIPSEAVNSLSGELNGFTRKGSTTVSQIPKSQYIPTYGEVLFIYWYGIR